jgi:hypothetical protein
MGWLPEGVACEPPRNLGARVATLIFLRGGRVATLKNLGWPERPLGVSHAPPSFFLFFFY